MPPKRFLWQQVTFGKSRAGRGPGKGRVGDGCDVGCVGRARSPEAGRTWRVEAFLCVDSAEVYGRVGRCVVGFSEGLCTLQE